MGSTFAWERHLRGSGILPRSRLEAAPIIPHHWPPNQESRLKGGSIGCWWRWQEWTRRCAPRPTGVLRTSKTGCAAFCEPATLVRLAPSAQMKRGCPRGQPHFMLVEVARIELASASPTLRGLHAYTVFNLTMGYPTGRENSQPAQQGFNGLSPEHARAAVLCR